MRELVPLVLYLLVILISSNLKCLFIYFTYFSVGYLLISNLYIVEIYNDYIYNIFIYIR